MNLKLWRGMSKSESHLTLGVYCSRHKLCRQSTDDLDYNMQGLILKKRDCLYVMTDPRIKYYYYCFPTHSYVTRTESNLSNLHHRSLQEVGLCQVGVLTQTQILVFYILHTKNLMSFTKLLLILQENT